MFAVDRWIDRPTAQTIGKEVDSGKSPRKLTPIQTLLWKAHAAGGSWEAVAERVPGATGEALRRIAEGITKRPQRTTVDSITSSLADAPPPVGASREAFAILSLMREAVTRQERLVESLKNAGVPDDDAASIAAAHAPGKGAASAKRKGAGG